MLPVINEFKCGRCGKCCTNIKGAFSTRSSESQRIIFSLKEHGEIGLPLWEWEADRLGALAKERSLKANIEPLHFFYDKKSKRSVIVSFHLDNDSCIFYEPGKCGIYLRRPFVCSMFPVIKSSVFDFVFGKKSIKIDKTLCPNDRGHEVISGNMTVSEYVSEMEGYYGDAFEMSVQNDAVNYFIVKKVKQMSDDGVIDPIISPRQLALKRFEAAEKIRFFDFLEEKGEDKQGIISDLSYPGQARKLLNSIRN